MRKIAAILCVLVGAAGAEGDADHSNKAKPAKAKLPVSKVLKVQVNKGDRVKGQNSVSYEVETSETNGQRVNKRMESVQRTEKFVDVIKESGQLGVVRERSYLTRYEKVRTDGGRPEVLQDPLTGRTVLIRESKRRRVVSAIDGSRISPLVRRTVGMEIDWRDVLSKDPVKPGDEWEGDATALARRVAAHFDCGSRSKMRVRYEGDVEHEGARCAHLYIDWRIEGMRDRNLFTKVMLAGDAYLDLDNGRFIDIDLTGRLVVRGAILGKGFPTIIKGQGPVTLKSTLKAAPIQASAPSGE
ncbi:MAG: hypothetical protein V3T86_13760 [Planctomycetota bacterium]